MKIDVTPSLVNRVAELARLRLNEDELVYYQNQLGRILHYIERLDELDERLASLNVESQSEDSTLEREDQVSRLLNLDYALENAPKKVGTAFQVPKIIE